MAAPKHVSEKMLIAALRKCGGIFLLTAQEIGTTRQNVDIRVKGSAKLQAVCRQIENETLDYGEGHIVKGVRTGDKDYVKYYMDRKGRPRGYGASVQNSFDEAQFEALIASLGGDPSKFRQALVSLGVDPDQA